MGRKIWIIIPLLSAFAATLLAQPAEPRIEALKDNAEYMSLLEEDAILAEREDSIVKAIEIARRQFRENPAERSATSKHILSLESSIFELRSTKGRIMDRISAIEQEWVLSNINTETSRIITPVADSMQRRNMVYNAYFRENLAEEDYRALLEAQQMELTAVDIVNSFYANHNSLQELRDGYAEAKTEAEAMEIYDRFHSLQGMNNYLLDSLATTWNYIFDNKSYAYAYILETLNRVEMLAQEEKALSEAMRQIQGLEDQDTEITIADYFLRKRVMADYERSVAGILSLTVARDSLTGVVSQLSEIDWRVSPVEIEERYFLDYEPIEFTRTPRYTTRNPIPECKIYERGTIYRVLLGTFNTKRSVATFRGVYPLSYIINDDGKWSYFTGGFATRSEADEEQVRLKKHGFVRPEVVVWRNGKYRNLSTDPEPETEVGYRVEIAGTDALSDEVKGIIAEDAAGCELSRVGGGTFLVGTFTEEITAEGFASKLREADSGLEVKVVRIAATTE